MIRTALGLLGMVGMIAFASCSAHGADEVDDSVRFVVARPSTVTIERTPSGGWRVTIEPLDADPGLPAPPKPDPAGPDPIGDALAALPEADRVVVANLLINHAELAIAAIVEASNRGQPRPFQGHDPDVAALWLIARTTARLGPGLTAAQSGAIAAIADTLPDMPGGALTMKLKAMQAKLEKAVESR